MGEAVRAQEHSTLGAVFVPRHHPSATGDAAVLLGSRAVMFAASTAALIAVARILGPEQYGVLAAAGAISLTVQAFGALGLEQLYLRGDVDERELRTGSIHVAILQVVAAVAAAAVWPQLSTMTRLCTAALGVSQATATVRLPWLLLPHRRLEFAARARREAGAFLLTQVVIVAAVAGGQGPLGASVLAATAGLFLIGATRAQVGVRAAISPRRSWRLVRAGFPFVLSSVFYTVYFQVDAALLAALAAPAVVAQYAVAYSFVAAAAVIPIALNNDVLRPHLYRAASGSARRALMRRFAGLSLGLGIASGLSVFCFGPLMTRLLYGHRYDAAGVLLTILACALPFHFVNSWAGNVLVGATRVRLVVAVQAALTCSNIALNLILIPMLGARGAAVATVATEAAGMVLYSVCLLLCRASLAVAIATSRFPQR